MSKTGYNISLKGHVGIYDFYRAAYKNHGNVNVHFVYINASGNTIASLIEV